MKKSMLLLCLAAAAMTSCTNEETLEMAESRAIGFWGSGIGNVTKAGDITPSNFAQFYVYGGYEEEAIFNGQEVNYNASVWSYSPLQYWVADKTYNFGAYAPSATGIAPSWNYTAGLTLTVNSDANNQNDLVYADATATTPEDEAKLASQAAVSLNFTHLLSKIQFKFLKDTESLGGQKVEMANFKVAGIITNGQWIKGVQKTATESKGDYADFGGDDFANAQEIVATDGLSTTAWYVIPQTPTAFAITANVKVTDYADTVLKNGTISATLPIDVITTWAAQNQYLYIATIKMQNIDDPNNPNEELVPIKFTGSTVDWNKPVTEDNFTPEVVTPQN